MFFSAPHLSVLFSPQEKSLPHIQEASWSPSANGSTVCEAPGASQWLRIGKSLMECFYCSWNVLVCFIKNAQFEVELGGAFFSNKCLLILAWKHTRHFWGALLHGYCWVGIAGWALLDGHLWADISG